MTDQELDPNLWHRARTPERRAEVARAEFTRSMTVIQRAMRDLSAIFATFGSGANRG